MIPTVQTPKAQAQAVVTVTFDKLEIAHIVARSVSTSEYESVIIDWRSSVKFGGVMATATGASSTLSIVKVDETEF